MVESDGAVGDHELFAPAVESSKIAFEEWISHPPTKARAADSKDEGITFLACRLNSRQQVIDNTLVIDGLETAGRLVDGPRPPIVIARNAAVEQAMVPYNSRNSRRSILPTLVLGNSSTNCTVRGHL